MRGMQGLAAYNISLEQPDVLALCDRAVRPAGPGRPDTDTDDNGATLITAGIGVYMSSKAWFRVAYERQGFQGRAEHQRRAQRAGGELLARHGRGTPTCGDEHHADNSLSIAGALALAAPAAAQTLTGAGATFPNPIYTKWFDAYSKKTGVQINYQSIGSGGGIRQFTEGTVDFGATDGPMNESQIAAVSGNVLHVPTVLGAVVVTYNLPSLGDTKLKFDGDLLVDIFMGRVTKWNDKRIAALNPGVKLPDIDLIVVHRSDGSGTTYVFTDFLNKFSREWRTKSASRPR